MKNALLILLIINLNSRIVSSQDTTGFINGNCINHQKMVNDDTCPEGTFFTYDNDSLNIYGTIGANCCGTHLAVIKTINDTIFVSTIDTGLLCNCGCQFCFSLKIPASITDTIVCLNHTAFNIAEYITSSFNENIEDKIKLVPNPAKDNLTVFTGDINNELALLEIINSNGVLIKTIAINHPEIDLNLSNLQSGVYFIRFTMKNNTTFTRKIIKR